MATTATRSTTIVFTGDVTGTEVYTAASNSSSPGQLQIVALSSGNNTITLPTSSTTVASVTILPPTGNSVALILKGIAGDTGINLHPTDPTTIAFPNSGVTSFVINAGSAVNIRLTWT